MDFFITDPVILSIYMSILADTLSTYKKKFPFVLRTVRPILISQCIIVAIIILSYFVHTDDFSQVRQALLILMQAMVVVVAVVQVILYTPAALRTFQKEAEGIDEPIKKSVSIQRKRMWPFIQLMLYIFVYFVYYTLTSVVPGALLIYMAYYFLPTLTMIGSSILGVIGSALIVYGVAQNYCKMFFPINIYFAKHIAPLEAVQESIRFGETRRKGVWKAFGGFILISLIGLLIVMGLDYLISPEEFVKSLMIQKYQAPLDYRALTSFVSIIIGVFGVTPLTHMYMSKAYVKLEKEGK